ncbi:MAG: 30S ribosomal protein S11 [Candidatus Spechtbacteria bacterium SB0662_bin_43]|uniref:Small ribosomal subunit protein uS11 n=1 Tax=Candidatus Spechtbacteria bacterium SB0662_bin_43 TaxID=2604897 RepID=A0A845DAR5_9BACT|nr:30S ribosomal protein S11 [Candidatus Spechtbacteria bacterium SB0662_bin_43]
MGKIRIAQTTSEDVLRQSEAQQALINKARSNTRGKGRRVERGNIYVRTTYNNIAISFANEMGNIIAWSTSGAAGFKGPRKATPYAASRVVELVTEKVAKYDFQEVHIVLSGIGIGRDAALRSLATKGFNITKIVDATPVPHNGCRPKKPRRT